MMAAIEPKGPMPSLDPQPPPKKVGFRISWLVHHILKGLEIVSGVIAAISLISIALIPLPWPPLLALISIVAFTVLMAAHGVHCMRERLPFAVQRAIHAVSALVGEFFALLLSMPLMLFKMSTKRFKPEELKGEKPLVIFAHGFLHNSSGGWYLRHRVKEEGYLFVSLDQKGWFGAIEDYGDQLVQFTKQYDDYLEKHGLILWGHSMGGLASLYAANQLAQKGWKIRVVTFGSPLLGTRVAKCIFWKGVRQMGYGSSFTQKVVADAKAHKTIVCHHIGSSNDLLIWPAHSAILGRESDEAHQLLPGLGHLQLLFSDAAIDAAFKSLHDSSDKP